MLDTFARDFMSLRLRIFIVLTFAAALAGFAAGPDLLGLDEDGRIAWQAAMTLGGPLAAAIACLFASRKGTDAERSAWRNFASRF